MGLAGIAGSDAANTMDTTSQAMASAIDSQAAIFSQGTFASRPTSTPGTPGKTGRFYYATDTLELYYDYGTGWKRVLPPDPETVTADTLVDPLVAALGVNDSEGVRRGKSIIATEESRTNTSYGTLTTPDQVSSVVLPTDGLIAVAFTGMFKSSANAAGSAAIFIGATQLSYDNGGVAPGVQATPTTGTNVYRHLASTPIGLEMSSAGLTWTGDVTTGQAISASTSVGTPGGPCYVFAAAGTYTVSVQFKATSGSVTAKERKLWVWTIGF
jgi:hypothetical protein